MLYSLCEITGSAGLLLPADLPAGQDDQPRHWCAGCGLADAPATYPQAPCTRCGSLDRWFGRTADLTGADVPPPRGQCAGCYEWRRRPAAEHGWGWHRVCGTPGIASDWLCVCACHDGSEAWLG